MKGFADKPSYIIELLEGGMTIEDVIDGHICEQALVSSAFTSAGLLIASSFSGRNSQNTSNSFHDTVISTVICLMVSHRLSVRLAFSGFNQLLCVPNATVLWSRVSRWRRVPSQWVTLVP